MGGFRPSGEGGGTTGLYDNETNTVDVPRTMDRVGASYFLFDNKRKGTVTRIGDDGTLEVVFWDQSWVPQATRKALLEAGRSPVSTWDKQENSDPNEGT